MPLVGFSVARIAESNAADIVDSCDAFYSAFLIMEKHRESHKLDRGISGRTSPQSSH